MITFPLPVTPGGLPYLHGNHTDLQDAMAADTRLRKLRYWAKENPGQDDDAVRDLELRIHRHRAEAMLRRAMEADQ
ncbi:hypothetical protein M3D01_004065 [Micrococcus luteus]|nr:hypothetical protein [Micrococcus luteus]